ncbi:MAG TPA: hypothetical protein DD390_11290 [Rhodospirillaceae bacterium]|nr:hypothetical protein [Rhodospirillaceae bacterium]MAX62830.1 hypothetical protein [Rhodospirillaceae bacterium]MBB57675.1 hypothetical protein [Rhodospirillaceae bacterium]HBM13268.1 hypothetical protein [Rhodospirillaceae bacterium]|tara:strand:- start:25210 stop:26364 length:1155 start_codon:yes stop_codon:yes gene_type:complete
MASAKDEIDIEKWCETHGDKAIPIADSYTVRLWDGDGFDEKRRLDDRKPTGRQILGAFGRHPADEFELLMLSRDSVIERVNLDETIDLAAQGPERFFSFRTDRLHNLSIDGRRFSWGASSIEVSLLRLIARIPEDCDLYFEEQDEADRLLKETDILDLSQPNLEKVYSRKRKWKFDVQGVILTLAEPLIQVRDALVQAGFDPDKGWIAILKRKGEPKEQVTLDYLVDLTTPGIERLRLTPGEINNGEAVVSLRKEFALLPKDEEFLNRRGCVWETFIEGKRRWLKIHGFHLPSGYNKASVDLCIDVPEAYPGAALDMFYCHPQLVRANGSSIAQTDSRVDIQGVPHQMWSRHLNGSTRWNPASDSVLTHIAVVDECLLREVGDE